MANKKQQIKKTPYMTRHLDKDKIRQMQIEASNHGGPGSRFAGLKEKPKDTKGTIKKLVNYFSTYKKKLIFLLIGMVLMTAASLSTNVLMENVIDSMGQYNIESNNWTVIPDEHRFLTFIIALGAVYIVYCLLQYITNLFSNIMSCHIYQKMRNDLFKKIVRLPIKYLDTHKHGDIMSRMTNDISNISDCVGSILPSLISGFLTLVGCICIMLYYSPLMTLVAMVTLVLSILVTTLMSKFTRPLFLRQQGILGMLNSQTEEMVTGCKTVIAYNHQDLASGEFNYLSDDFCHTAIKASIWGGSMGPIMNFVGNVGYFLLCLAGALFIALGIGGTITGEPLIPAIVITFLTLNKQFTRPINEIAQFYSLIVTALAGAERVFKILEEESEDFSKKVDFDPNTTNGYIDFNHIGFSYIPTKPVLKDFNVDVRSGHKIALVGATGSGKTTIVNLLLRFYDIDSGKISIDGIDIMDMSKKDLRDSISIVLQDAFLFEDTIENNIKYGKENATDEEFWNAVKLANCDSFINTLPDKEKTLLTEGATNLSQGQRQLITIARAVLADPKILILDEATSSVDTRTEKNIQDAMVNLMKNRTSIIIAHRLSTIQDADFIVVLDQGVVIESGNHEELVALDGVYNRLYQTQFKGYNI